MGLISHSVPIHVNQYRPANALSHKFARATKGLKETKEPYLLLTASLDTGDIEKWTAEEKQATDQRGDALDIYQLRFDKGMY